MLCKKSSKNHKPLQRLQIFDSELQCCFGDRQYVADKWSASSLEPGVRQLRILWSSPLRLESPGGIITAAVVFAPPFSPSPTVNIELRYFPQHSISVFTKNQTLKQPPAKKTAKMPHLDFNHQAQMLTITLSTAETFLALFGSIAIPYSQIRQVRPLPGEAYMHFKSMGVYIPGVMTFATLNRTSNGKPEIYLYSSPLKTIGLDLQGHAHF
ncbi:hypothetical protein BDR26DRAFT_866050, partial [Obelidium mucronatum]